MDEVFGRRDMIAPDKLKALSVKSDARASARVGGYLGALALSGGALYFANLDAAGAGDPRTLHAGLAPTQGEKWVFSHWIRNRARV